MSHSDSGIGFEAREEMKCTEACFRVPQWTLQMLLGIQLAAPQIDSIGPN